MASLYDNILIGEMQDTNPSSTELIRPVKEHVTTNAHELRLEDEWTGIKSLFSAKNQYRHTYSTFECDMMCFSATVAEKTARKRNKQKVIREWKMGVFENWLCFVELYRKLLLSPSPEMRYLLDTVGNFTNYARTNNRGGPAIEIES